MPELPEVETYARDLAPCLPGRVLCGAQVTWPRQLPLNPAEAFGERRPVRPYCRSAGAASTWSCDCRRTGCSCT